MYKIRKDRGYDANVIVENTETFSSVTIGRMSLSIENILMKNGYTIETSVVDSMDLEVNKETAQELAATAMKGKRPVRSKKVTVAPTEKKPRNQIDAMDVLLGLASYN